MVPGPVELSRRHKGQRVSFWFSGATARAMRCASSATLFSIHVHSTHVYDHVGSSARGCSGGYRCSRQTTGQEVAMPVRKKVGTESPLRDAMIDFMAKMTKTDSEEDIANLLKSFIMEMEALGYLASVKHDSKSGASFIDVMQPTTAERAYIPLKHGVLDSYLRQVHEAIDKAENILSIQSASEPSDIEIDSSLAEEALHALGMIALRVRQDKYVRADLDEQVSSARAAGMSWANIGKAAGISSQSAQRRWDPKSRRNHAEYQRNWRR
jgi:hypothetical protein